MEVWLLVALATLLCLLLAVPTLLRGRNTSHGDRPHGRGGVEASRGPGGRRGPRMRRQERRDEDDSQDEEEDRREELEDLEEAGIKVPDGKIGKKKMEKLQAKADKKRERESELREREEAKKKREQEEEEAKKLRGREMEDEKRQEEEERRRREEKERQEQEEYLKLKAAFTVEEEGCDAEEDSEENKLQKFIAYIQETKVVLLEDLAAHFKMKTQDAIDRVKILQESGDLTGVVDDRGKFIFISREELESVARFIRQQCRVSITDLAAISNKLISLN